MRAALNVILKVLAVLAVIIVLTATQTHNLEAGLLGGAFVILGLLGSWLLEHIHQRDNQRKPVITVEAKTVSHRMFRERVGRTTVVRYYITFKTTDGELLEFSVSQFDFEDFDIGETGPLRYRGWEFLSFGVKDKSHIKPIAPLPEEYDRIEEEESLRDKAAAFLSELAERSRQESTQDEPAKDDGVLTHELDE